MYTKKWKKFPRIQTFSQIETLYSEYRKVANRSTCYYSENQVFGGATNRDMSLTETCFYSQIQKLDFKSRLVTCPKYRYVGTFR
jgi:hypothetical protein